jgi:polyphosphate kinase 2 (PPK2 family)
VEKYIVSNGIQLIKIWLESSEKEQKRRFEARIEDPLRQWKLAQWICVRVSAGSITPAPAT